MPTFLLEGQHRLDGLAAGAAVDAAGIEAARGEPALDLLDLGQRRRALAAGELPVQQRPPVADQVAERQSGERIGLGGIVGFHGVEIASDQKGRTAAHRGP